MVEANGIPTHFNGAGNGKPVPTVNEGFKRDAKHLEYLDGLVGNAMLMRSQLFQFLLDPRRNIDDECGYPPSNPGQGWGSLNPELFRSLYEREPIATRVVQLYPKERWKVTPSVYENEKGKVSTKFEEAWDELGQSLRGESCWFQDEEGSPIWEQLKRADILSGIGHFGVILLGIADNKPLDQPVDGVVEYTNTPTGNLMTINQTKRKIETISQIVTNSEGKREVRVVGTRVVRGITKQMTYPTRPTDEVLDYPTYKNDEKYGLPITDNVRMKYPDAEQITENIKKGYGISSDTSAFGERGNSSDKSNRPTGPARTSDGQIFPQSQSDRDDIYMGVQLSPSEMPKSKKGDKKNGGKSDQSKLTQLLFLRCYDESLVQIVQYEADVRNPRFGMPVIYRITLNDPREQHSGVGIPMATVRVHWSRIIHIADNLGSSEIFGVPRMRPVLNRILDLRKVYGAAAEGYWKSCFAAISLETNPSMGGDVDINRDEIKNMMELFENGLQRNLTLIGLSAKTLAPQVIDPTPHIAVGIEAICIELDVPVPVFKGYEIGEQASENNDSDWNDRVSGSQNNYATPKLIVPLIDRLISAGCLPEPEGYSIEWPSLDTMSEKDESTVALTKTQALGAYVSGGLEQIMTPLDYLTQILGMDEEKAQGIIDSAEEAIQEQVDDHPTDDQGNPTITPAPPPGHEAIQPPQPDPNGAPVKVKPGESLVDPKDGKTIASGDNPKPKPPGPGFAKRPQPSTNVFCPTGEGGGIDPSCTAHDARQTSTAPFHAEPHTPPPPGQAYKPNVLADTTHNGITDAARVGVPAMSVPPPPKIGRLPNLTPRERSIEHAFIDNYEKNPDKAAKDFHAIVSKMTKPRQPKTFGTDDAKELTEVWMHSDPVTRSQNRATLNTALHQTANAITKRAFLQELDTLKAGDEVMVTVGGCGAGKGYAIGGKDKDGNPFVPQAAAIKARCKVVWDSAGDQNATENPWIQHEAEKRGLKVNYLYVHADPYTQWAHPERGVVKRAADPKDGRMVDAMVFADSYALGAKNHQAFYDTNKHNPSASFIFLENRGKPTLLDGIPSDALSIDRKKLTNFAIDAVTKSDAPDHVKRGALIGTRIWSEEHANGS